MSIEDMVRRIVYAKMNGTYSYSSLQIPLPETLANRVMAWGIRNIKDENLFYGDDDTMGREDYIHTTVFYGIKDGSPDKVKKLIKGLGPIEIRLGLITPFKDGKDHDVIKIEAESSKIQKLHYDVGEYIPHNNKFPTYQPHITIAYVKKGTCDDLIGDDTFKGTVFTSTGVEFSSKDGDKIFLNI